MTAFHFVDGVKAAHDAVAALSAHEWVAGQPWSRHDRHQYDGQCQVCRDPIGAALRAIEMVVTPQHLWAVKPSEASQETSS